MKKKVIALLLSMVVAANLMACGNTTEEASNTSQTAENPEEDVTEGETETETPEDGEMLENTEGNEDVKLVEGSYTIGISQFAEHGSLDNCKEGFLAGLAEEGFVEGENLTVLFDNAQADTGTTSTIADNYVSQNVDLICGIATPSAMSAYNSTMNTEIPVIYTAVSDPVAAGLAEEDGTPVGNITGTSDYLAVTEQLQMIRDILPDAKTIGIIYTTSETNSESTIAEYKKHAQEYGFEIVDTGINTIGDVELAAANLADKVDCITNLTDNTVVSALQTELAAANAKNIPVFGSEIEQVKSGCVASMGLEYFELGKQTGHMAAKVLKGEAKASEMQFETITEASLYVNTEAANKIGLTLAEEFVNSAYQVFDTIVVE
ncbi:MAG: ABC transporter substrate-binding protein [Lachnospiraceae bacterium]|nr:ABC transporter substrate-binding protein [Lachnospiraceae bacterium]